MLFGRLLFLFIEFDLCARCKRLIPKSKMMNWRMILGTSLGISFETRDAMPFRSERRKNPDASTRKRGRPSKENALNKCRKNSASASNVMDDGIDEAYLSVNFSIVVCRQYMRRIICISSTCLSIFTKYFYM